MPPAALAALAAPVTLDVDDARFVLRRARRDDLSALIELLAADALPGLARGGGTRMQVEAVRVAEATRGNGLGTAMLQWAVDEARSQGAALVQLTSDARREDAHRFYERLGFAASHVGFKLFL
jgi:GNAT superfamily N-acetyltransferase